jgi:hypothetical protein
MLARILLASIVLIALFGAVGLGDDNCRGFISTTCCCTNDCCWEIAASEAQPLSRDRWLIKATGQIVNRTGFSPDGKYYRCACDRDSTTGKWIRHQGAQTRCLYTPMHLY